jgi:predicted NBD/HSP70 family sugar kinase
MAKRRTARKTGKSSPSLNGQLLTPSDIGDVNRSRVIQAFCDYGPLTRAELAKMAGVTRATIGNIVSGLVDDGLIEEREPVEASGRVGKPGRPLWFGPKAGLAGAVSIERERVRVALVNARGELLTESEIAFDADDPSGRSVAKAVETALVGAMPRSRRELLGIGIAIPGVCDTSTGNILGSGQVPGLRGTTLAESIHRRFRLRVLLDNDSRSQALGEKWFGLGRQVPTFASIQTGHGIGVGLVIGGTVLRGAHGEAGEAGHTRVVTDGEPCRCGLSGCWETIASLGWLRREATRLRLPDAKKLDGRALVRLAETGNEKAIELLRAYAANLAIGLANLTQILSPGLFILHGDAVGGGEVLRSLIEEEMRRRVLPHVRGSVEVVASQLDQRATLLGAAGLVLSETFHLSV